MARFARRNENHPHITGIMCGLSDRHRTGFRVGRKGLLVPRTGSPILRNRPGVGPVCSVEQRTYGVIWVLECHFWLTHMD